MKKQVSVAMQGTVHVTATVIRGTAHGMDNRASGEWVDEREGVPYIDVDGIRISPAEQFVRLVFCIVAITAPKGRIDEFLGDHQSGGNLASHEGCGSAVSGSRERLCA
jgi:hypothetical protein